MPEFKTKPGAINHETFLKIDRIISIQKVKALCTYKAGWKILIKNDQSHFLMIQSHNADHFLNCFSTH